jgi:hypothetical protein
LLLDHFHHAPQRPRLVVSDDHWRPYETRRGFHRCEFGGEGRYHPCTELSDLDEMMDSMETLRYRLQDKEIEKKKKKAPTRKKNTKRKDMKEEMNAIKCHLSMMFA